MNGKLTFNSILTASLLLLLHPLSASLIIFEEGVLDEGQLFVDSIGNATTTITSTQPFNGFDTIEFTQLNGSFRSGGISFFNDDAVTVPTGDTLLVIQYRADTTQQIARLTLQTSAGDLNYSNANPDAWTINSGAIPTNTSNLLADTWYTLTFDLTAISGFTPGTTQFNGQMAFTNRLSTGSIYMGDVRTATVIPEPSTAPLLIGMATLVMGVLLRRKQSNR